jgi:hypothetical protein
MGIIASCPDATLNIVAPAIMVSLSSPHLMVPIASSQAVVLQQVARSCTVQDTLPQGDEPPGGGKVYVQHYCCANRTHARVLTFLHQFTSYTKFHKENLCFRCSNGGKLLEPMRCAALRHRTRNWRTLTAVTGVSPGDFQPSMNAQVARRSKRCDFL